MKTIKIFAAFALILVGGLQVQAQSDTVYIYRVGQPWMKSYAYAIDSGQPMRFWKEYTIKNEKQQIVHFNSSKLAAKFIGGEIVWRKFKRTYKEIKPVYMVVIPKENISLTSMK